MEENPSQNAQSHKESAENLGRGVDNFPIRYRNLKRLLALTSGILLILISLAGLFYLTLLIWNTVIIHGWAILTTKLLLILLLFLLLILGSLLTCCAKRHWNDGIIVFERGFTRQHKKKTRSWLWTDIDQLDTRVISSIFGGSEVNSRVKIFVKAENQKAFNIPNRYERMSDLAQEIRNQTLPVLYQKFLQSLSQTAQFDFQINLKLTQQGLIYNQQQVDWNEIKTVETHGGMLTFTGEDSSKILVKIPLTEIKNLDLLLFLMHNPDFREYLSP